MEKLENVIKDTPELDRRIYIAIHFHVIDKTDSFNIFGKPIPRQIGDCIDFKVKGGDVEFVAEDFFGDVDRARFVDYNFIEITFTGIKDV